MTRNTWMEDLRNAEEILIYAGEAMHNDKDEVRRWKFVYLIAVAVYHLLLDKVKGG